MTIADLPLSQQETPQLAHRYDELRTLIEAWQGELEEITYILIKRAESDTALADNDRTMALHDPDFDIEVERKPEVDHRKLAAHAFERGAVFKQSLIDDEAYVPDSVTISGFTHPEAFGVYEKYVRKNPHLRTKHVDERFNMTKMKPYVRKYSDVREAVQAATTMGAAKLHVKPKHALSEVEEKGTTP